MIALVPRAGHPSGLSPIPVAAQNAVAVAPDFSQAHTVLTFGDKLKTRVSLEQHLNPTMLDPLIIAADRALRTLSGAVTAARPTPRPAPAGASRGAAPSFADEEAELSEAEKTLSGALMRVNHVGEVCAQALYQSQAMATSDAAMRQRLEAAARDETDHLAWTQQRLDELGARASLLNPLWYAGSFTLGWVAGRLGDRWSLGFLVETERQVERHLAEHMDRLPPTDHRSRAIVQQMKIDEARHAQEAQEAGAAELPVAVRRGMRFLSKVMTRTAHHL